MDKKQNIMSSRESRANVVHVLPTMRRNSKERMPPKMSDLRIVLLGRSVSENSRVGNLILGRAAFDSESEPYTERIRGKHMTVINTPLLLNPDLSLRHMTQGVKECVSLSDPGPHVIVLVLKPDECLREEKQYLETVLRCFSESVFEHTLVLTTQEPDSPEPTEVSDVMKEIIHKCLNRHYRLGRNSTSADLRAIFEDIVQGNGGRYLTCNKYEDLYFTTERAAQTGQGKTIRPRQSSVDNNEKTSRENTSSKTMGGLQSYGTGLSVAHKIKNNWSRKIADGNNENLPMFKLRLSETWKNRDGFCRRSTFGKENVTKENKTIMMIGATGSGKTTLINSMINYILGVEWEDDFRFVLIDEGKQKSQAESQTSEITAYQINHMDDFKVPYSLTIVDTPGFGDTRGISHDQKITKQIQEFFSARGGIDRIDAVCFVVQASLARLTHTQKYIFDSILSIFGKDISGNILMMATFADGKRPPVLEAIKVSGVPCAKNESGEPLHFKFNNSAVFAINNKSGKAAANCDNFDQMFWKMGFSSMNIFFTSLNTMETKSLSLTQEVLKERQQLEVLVEGLQPQISAGLTKLDEIKKTRAALQQHKAEMEANKDFEYEVNVTVPKQILNNTGYFLTNCQQCHFTCHDTCIYGDDRDKHKCWAMKDGKCTVCPGKCDWNVHFNQAYKWTYVPEKRKETYEDLKKRYEAAHGQVMSKEKIFEELENEFQVVQFGVTRVIQRSQMSLERLQEIALKPNPLSTPDYIDLMIKSEKQEAKPGFQDRIQSLMDVRKKAEIISKIPTGEVLPEDWKQYKHTTRRKSFYNPRNWFSWPSKPQK